MALCVDKLPAYKLPKDFVRMGTATAAAIRSVYLPPAISCSLRSTAPSPSLARPLATLIYLPPSPPQPPPPPVAPGGGGGGGGGAL